MQFFVAIIIDRQILVVFVVVRFLEEGVNMEQNRLRARRK